MSALSIVITSLIGSSAVTDVVGTAVYPIAAPQGFAIPYVLVSLIGENEDQLINGASGYYESRVLVSCVCKDPTSANALGEAVKAALGDITKQTIGSATSVDVMKDGADFTDHSDDRSVFRRVLDFTVRWR